MSSLCKACLPIFQDHHELPPDIENPFKFGYGKFKLHGTATGLLESAGSGCVLCLRICNLARREWWLQLAEDQKLKLPLIKAAYFSLEWALQPFENGLKIQFKLTAALAHSISPLYRNFSLLVVRKDDAPSVSWQADLGLSTASKKAWAVAKSWLVHCAHGHSACGRDHKGPMFQPTRLLHIGDNVDSPVKLCLFESFPDEVRYTSLSHRWGSVQIIRLLVANMHQLRQGISMASLPKTFVDAIAFTRYIGLEYIWIDSLCIIQDDKDDWRREAAKMGEVYRYSWCNIAATGFQDSTNGMLAARDPRIVSPILFKRSQDYKKTIVPFAIQMMPSAGGPTYDPPFKIRSHAQEQARRQQIFLDGEYMCFDEAFWERSVTKAPLSSRGWVFQERLLSPRTLHFGAEQLLWECRESEACEMFAGGLPHNFHEAITYKSRRAADTITHGSDSSTLEAALNTWNSILASYTTTSLTKQSDRLPALSGVAKDIQAKLNSRYLAGLWEKWLIYQLLWHVEKPDRTGIGNSGAPSWSWAATTGTVKGSSFIDSDDKRECLVANIVDAQVANLGDEMGEVLTGTINVTGVLIHLFPTPEKFDWRKYPQKLEDTLTPFLFFWPYGTREYTKYSAKTEGKRNGVEIDPTIYLDKLPWPDNLYLLPIIHQADHTQGLVVAPASSDELGGPWRRQGMFEFGSKWKGATSFSQLIRELGGTDGEKSICLI